MNQARWIFYTLFLWIAMAASPSSAMPAVSAEHGKDAHASRITSSVSHLPAATTLDVIDPDEPAYQAPAARKVNLIDGKADALAPSSWQPCLTYTLAEHSFASAPLYAARRKSVPSSPRAPPLL